MVEDQPAVYSTVLSIYFLDTRYLSVNCTVFIHNHTVYSLYIICYISVSPVNYRPYVYCVTDFHTRLQTMYTSIYFIQNLNKLRNIHIHILYTQDIGNIIKYSLLGILTLKSAGPDPVYPDYRRGTTRSVQNSTVEPLTGERDPKILILHLAQNIKCSDQTYCTQKTYFLPLFFKQAIRSVAG